MKDEFFNYKIYAIEGDDIPEENESNPKNDAVELSPLIVLCDTSLTSESRNKLHQILKAGQFTIDECTIISGQEAEAAIETIITNPIVEDILSFGDLKEFDHFEKNVLGKLNGRNVFVTHSLAQLIQEEKEGKVDFRKALWKGIKSWRLK